MSFYLPKSLIALCILLAVMGVSGCGGDDDIRILSDDEPEVPVKISEPPPIPENVDIIACPDTDTLADYEDGFTLLINDPHEFRERYLGSLPNQQSDPPEIDFDNKSVIAVHAGVRSSANQRVRITEVDEGSESIEVTYQVVVPCGGDDASLTYPFCFVAIDKHEGPISFTEADELCVE